MNECTPTSPMPMHAWLPYANARLAPSPPCPCRDYREQPSYRDRGEGAPRRSRSPSRERDRDRGGYGRERERNGGGSRRSRSRSRDRGERREAGGGRDARDVFKESVKVVAGDRPREDVRMRY